VYALFTFSLGQIIHDYEYPQVYMYMTKQVIVKEEMENKLHRTQSDETFEINNQTKQIPLAAIGTFMEKVRVFS
jgi:hypothetical protein